MKKWAEVNKYRVKYQTYVKKVKNFGGDSSKAILSNLLPVHLSVVILIYNISPTYTRSLIDSSIISYVTP